MGRWIHRLLQGTYDHHSCYFPAGRKSLLFYLLRYLFNGVRFDTPQKKVIQDIPEDAIVVYVHKYKNYFDYLFFHTRYAIDGLPVPEIGFDYNFFFFQPISRIFRITLAHTLYFFKRMSFLTPYESGYIQKELLNGKAGILSLVEKKGFYLRFVKSNPDPLRFLIDFQQQTDRPIFIVPQLLFFSKKPRKSTLSMIDIFFGTEEKPGQTRRIVGLIRKPENVFLEISEPLNLMAFLKLSENQELTQEKQAFALRRWLLDQTNRHRQSITGPVLKSHEELKENILTNDRLRSFMRQYAENRKQSIYKVYKEANEYLDEIAAKYNITLIQIASRMVKWLTSLMFEGLSYNPDMLNRAKAMSRKGPLILIPCHKSHIDYLILSYVLYQNDMPCPHVAAGKNLSFWPMGPIFRAGGAFFIRRTFRGAMLYSKVFAEYIFKLLEEGFNIEFFIEGGRSRTGKLLQPKLGLLSMLLNAYREGACEDLIFVPVFVGYDRVPEEKAYLSELEGGQKKPESLMQMINASKLLKKRYGRIYIRFHEPISLNQMLARDGKNIHELTPKEQNRLCRHLGYKIVNNIDGVTVVTPHALMAAAIMNNGKNRFLYADLIADIETYMNYLTSQKATLADTLLMDQNRVFEYVFDTYLQRRFIEPVSDDKDGAEPQFTINTGKRSALEYYKNNCASVFIPAAFTALAILERDAFQFSGDDVFDGYYFLRNFFACEFAYDAEKSVELFIHKNIKSFIDDAIVMPHPTLPDTYNITSAGFRKLKLFSAVLTTYFESYWIVLNFFMRYPKDFAASKDRIKKIQSMGNRMYKKREIEHPEALSRVNYQNAVDCFVNNGIKGSEDDEKIQLYAKKIRSYLNILRP
jgi:glycerol-3-phosphate O-acyltransferase